MQKSSVQWFKNIFWIYSTLENVSNSFRIRQIRMIQFFKHFIYFKKNYVSTLNVNLMISKLLVLQATFKFQ